MLSVQKVFITPQDKQARAEHIKFQVEEGDLITYLNVFEAFIKSKKNPSWCFKHFLNFKSLSRAVTIRSQLVKYLKRLDIRIQSCGIDTASLRKCLVTGYFSQAAKLLPNGTYVTIRDNIPLRIHPTSDLYRRSPAYVLFHEFTQTDNAYMNDVTVIESRWLTDFAPHYYEVKPLNK